MSDARIAQRVDDYILGYRTEITRVVKEYRDEYEHHRSKDNARIASIEAQVKAMREAGQAVVKRWDDPKWEWDKHGHTASLIADLRKSLDTPTPTPPNK